MDPGALKRNSAVRRLSSLPAQQLENPSVFLCNYLFLSLFFLSLSLSAYPYSMRKQYRQLLTPVYVIPVIPGIIVITCHIRAAVS